MGVFSYEDSFGPQGIISVVLLLNEEKRVVVDSWLMSCRVLNRGVEQAIFGWLLEHAGGRRIEADYLPTAKNGFVAELYPNLGFQPSGNGGEPEIEGATRWEVAAPEKVTPPDHHVTLLR